MLGHIFENLLEDNKEKGAFYTPKIIVQYMCQESLIEYLKTNLNLNEDESGTKAVINIVRNRLAEQASDLDLVESISKALYEVKICDPAIGSGAFPMGILNVIFQVIEELYWIEPDSVARVWGINPINWEPHLVKKNIIQHSIYGIDIESGAVDIARLRFWLALVVDETKPLPLPNLDYKIVQGNSLLESYEGIDLSQINDASAYEVNYDSTQMNLFTGEAKKKVTISLDFEDIKTLMDDYFNANDPVTKKNLHKRIDDQVLNHIRISLSKKTSKIARKRKKLERKIEINVENNLNNNVFIQQLRTDSKEAKELVIAEKELKSYLDKEVNLEKLSKSNERPFFLWHLFFKEVFESGGFDIVIGNPPYIGEKGNETIFQEVLTSELGAKYYTRWMDYFYFFFHLGINNLKPSGNLIYITTNYYFTSTGGYKLRADLKDRSSVLKLINFNEIKIFESATGQHNVITHLKKEINGTTKALTINAKSSGAYSPAKLRSILNKTSEDADYYTVEQEMLFENSDSQIRIQGKGRNDGVSTSVADVLQKMNNKSEKLGDVTIIAMGVVTLSDTVSNNHIKKFNVKHNKGEGIYVLSQEEVDSLNLTQTELNEYIKPFYKNSDIVRYQCEPENKKWLIYIKDKGKPINLPKGLKTHFEKYKTIVVGLKDNFLKNAIAASIVKKWYANGNYFVLFTPKKEEYFIGEKIVAPYRCKENIFGYCNSPFFGSKDVAYILPGNPDYPLKYITCILNSKLIYHWLYNKGKRKGETLELYRKPLTEIPIKKCSKDVYLFFEKKYNSILKENGSIDHELVKELDLYIYRLYSLTYEDMLIIEPNNKEIISKDDYEKEYNL